MDMPKPAASRVRHILQAMERSIDSARSRRTNAPAPAAAAPTNTASHASAATEQASNMRTFGHSASSPTNTLIGAGPQRTQHAPQQQTHAYPIASAPRPAATTPNSSALIGGGSMPQRPVVAPVDPNQPARIKAKPKRFESTFAAQFAQNPQTEYRAQTG